MPTGAAKPSIFREPRLRLKVEVLRLKTWVENLRGYLSFISRKESRCQWLILIQCVESWHTNTLLHKNPTRSLHAERLSRLQLLCTRGCTLRLLSKRCVSISQWRDFLTLSSRNDTATLSSICTEGLLASFRSRLALNPHDVTQRWILNRYLRSPYIVSDRANMLQVTDTAIRQVVVRIQSSQSLVKIKRHPQTKEEVIVSGTDSEQMMDEYLVMQRRIWRGQEEGWRIWGTTLEADVKKVVEDNENKTNIRIR